MAIVPHDEISPIPNTLPEAIPELWNTRYTQIDENFAALDLAVEGAAGELEAARNTSPTLAERLEKIENSADYRAIRTVAFTPPSNATVSDNILVDDLRGIVNYAPNGNGWGHVMLPSLASIPEDQTRSVITIVNTSLNDEGEVRVVPYGYPGAGQDFIYNKNDPLFYTRGCVTLERGASVVLVPAPDPVYPLWWVLAESRPSLMSRSAAVALNLSALVGADGVVGLLAKRGFLGLMVTKMTGSGNGVYQLDWGDSFWLGGYPQVYVQPVASDGAVYVARVTPTPYNSGTQKYEKTATVTIYRNGVQYDCAFNVLITVYTANTYAP